MSSHTLTGDHHVNMYSTCGSKGYCCLFAVEVEGSSQGCVRAFTRIFIATPASYASLCIVNDELFVRDASPSETQECVLHLNAYTLLPLPGAAGNGAGFLHPVWDETRVVSEVPSGQ